jgi:hypothetical protein
LLAGVLGFVNTNTCGILSDMNSPRVAVRVREDLEAAARSASPELSDLSISELLRAGLAMLAGAATAAEAIATARMTRAPRNPNGGRPPRA